MQAPSCSFLCLAGTPAATSADTVVGALGWQPRHSLSIRRQGLSRRCPISSWKRISAAAASNSNSAASFDKDGASAGADGSCGGAKGDGRAASAEAAKAAAAAAVADMFLQLDATLDEDQPMVVGASAPSGATDDEKHNRGTTTTREERGISLGNRVRGANRDNNTRFRRSAGGGEAGRRGGGMGGGGRGEQLVDLAEEIKAAAAKRSWEEVSAVVARAKSSGLRLDGRVHTAVLHAALGGGGARAALGAIADMRADKFVPNVSLYNKAISLCGRQGLWKEAVFLLRDALAAPPARRGVDVVTYSAAIAACRNGGEWKQALSLMEEMQATGIKPDQIAFGTAVSACAMGGQWQRARLLLAEMRRSNLRPDVIAYSSAVKACGVDGRWEEALELLTEMQECGVRPNLITYTGAMEACGRAGKWKKALSLLSQVRDRGIQPDTFALNAVMDALARAGETEMALALLDTMRPTRRQASSSTRIPRSNSAAQRPLGSPTIDANHVDTGGGLGRGRRGGDLGRKLGQGRPMAGSGPHADVFTWSGAMTACIEGGCWERVVGMLEDMRGDGVPPNLINFNLAVKALGKGGDWERAISILEEMKSEGVDPDERTFSAAIEACGRGGCWERAVSLMDDMRREGLVPDELTYSTVIAACDRAGAWDVGLMMLDEAREQDGERSNVFAYTSAISACGKAGQWEKAVSLLDVMRKEGVLPNAVTLRSALLALENAPPPCLETRGQAAPIRRSNDAASEEKTLVLPCASDAKDSSSRLVGVRAETGKKRSRGWATSCPPLPWEVAFLLLDSMASGALEEKVFPGPRDFSAGLTSACLGGAKWSSIEQMLDRMHACAANSVSALDDGTGDGIAGGLPVPAGSERGNDEWGPGRGEAGIVQAYNYVIRACGKAGGSEIALDLIQQMRKRGVAPNAASYSEAIIACDLAGMWDQAIALLDDMRDKVGIEPDLVCYNCAVKACGSSGEWEEALSIIETMRARGVAPDEITYSSAITACGNSGEAAAALNLLREMKEAGVPAGLIAHNAAIGACDKGGEWSSTLRVLGEMHAAGIRPDVISYTGAISSVDKAGEWRLALELYDQLRADMAKGATGGGEGQDTTRPGDTPLGTGQEIPPPRVTVAALTACARGAQWEKAVEIMREVSATSGKDGGDGVWYHLGPASPLAFNAALVACAKGAEAEAEEGRDGGWREALEILEMIGPAPDLTSYGCAITACGFGGNVEACVGLLGEMIRRNMTPTLADYHSSLRACSARRRDDAAQEILESMASECVEPDARCYRFAAEACVGAEDDGKPSAESDRLLGIARGLEASKESVGQGEQDDGSSFRSSLDLSNATTLDALLEPAIGEEFSDFG